MRFLVDESLPPQLAEGLGALGHDAIHLQDAGLSGSDDETVFAAASARSAILITQDLDFSDERRFRAGVGLIVIRFRHRLSRDEMVRRCLLTFERFGGEIERLGNGIMILEPGRSRIRRRL